MTALSPGAKRLFWAFLFAVAFAFVESAVVVYLRALYYPGGFFFPLRVLATDHVAVELARELSTMIMIATVAALAGFSAWERIGFFLFIFGIWDIFFYGWLRVCINWPRTLFDWDILFLIPVPWIGPVIAPVLVALTMAICGTIVVLRTERGMSIQPGFLPLGLWLAGTAVILYSFVADTGATLGGVMPQPYRYELLGLGLLLYIVAFSTLKTSTQSAAKQ
jgi:hypothetical protein